MDIDSLFNEPPSAKARRFADALVRLCREHDVRLTVEAYDAIQVWDLKQEEDPVYVPTIQDRTKSPHPEG